MEKNQAEDDATKKKELGSMSGETSTSSDASPKVLPLHRRRFDAKQRMFPSELTALPNDSISIARPPLVSSRKFCEDLTERLKRDETTLEDLQPLFARSANTAAATLITEDAFDHLDKLYMLMEQLLTLKEQNSKIQRRVRDLEHIKKLQEMHGQIEKEMMRTRATDPEAFYRNEATSMDLGEEYEYTEALLESMLEAGRNASLKRAKWKSPSRSKLRQSIVRNQRSRSMGGEELESCSIPENDYSSRLTVPYKPGRRASEMKSTDKSKISKWTRVKAAFKWERAHTGIAEDAPAAIPIARVSLPSVISVTPLTPGTPMTPVATPASMTPASSMDDVGENGSCPHDSSRRSRSLDSSAVLDSVSGQLSQQEEMCNPSNAKLHKTPWGKMKDIIQTRKESVRKKQNRNSIRSSSGCRTSENYSLSDGGGLSQSESAEILYGVDKNSPKRKISGQERGEISVQDSDSARRTTPTLTVTMPSSEELAKVNKVSSAPEASTSAAADQMYKIGSQTKTEVNPERSHQLLTKQKSLDFTKRPIKRAGAIQDSSDVDTGSPVVHRHDSKWKKVKKAFLTSAPTSTPSSPSRNSAFFSYEPEDIRIGCNRSKGGLEEEVRRDYEALQNRLSREFCDKAAEWSTGGPGSASGNSPSGGHSPNQNFVKKMDEWEKIKCNIGGNRQIGSGPPTPAEERLSADFRKKLHEWQKSKGVVSNQSVPTAASAFPNIPTHAQLSEDFRKKLEEWKRLKATNSVPTYTGDDSDRPPRDHERDERILKLKKAVGPQKKEVLVQTGAGFFRFEGISRSFTRKLHEWEKSRGIAPEASTTALLRESLARPPLPVTRTTGNGPWPSGYQKNERGVLRLQRSQSVGSVRDDAIPHVSASASSLSLTHLDDCSNENQVSDVGEECFDTSIEAEIRPLGTESDSDGGPGAVLVEVEDEVEETAAPLVACSPCAAPQTPVYRYGQAQERHRACESTDGKLTPVAYSISAPPHPWMNLIYALQDITLQLTKEEENIQKLLAGEFNVKERHADVTKKIEEYKGQSPVTSAKFGDLKRRMSRLDKEKELLQNSLKDRMNNFNQLVVKLCTNVKELMLDNKEAPHSLMKSIIVCNQKVESLNKRCIERYKSLNSDEISESTFIDELNQISICIDQFKLDCTKNNIQSRENSLCITYTANKPKAKEIILKTELEENSNSLNINANKDFNDSKKCQDLSEMSGKISSIDDRIDDSAKGARRKTKDAVERVSLSTAKRKSKIRQRLEREKSLQSESDTEEEVSTITVEFPRRKKLIKSKGSIDSHCNYPRQSSFEKQSNTDSGENVFVLKLKPKLNSQSSLNNELDLADTCTKKGIVVKKASLDASSDNLSEKDDSLEIILSPEQLPIDIPSEGIEVQAELNNNSDVFVKTTRKIFSPVRRDSKGEAKAVIGFNLEEIANSIVKTEVETKKKEENLPDILVNNEIKRSESNSTGANSKLKKDVFELKRQLNISSSDSIINTRSKTPSPLILRKNFNSNSSSRTLSVSRNPSEESIYQPRDVLPIRRGSGERFIGIKGSPVLSRASTPGISASLPPLPASPPTARRDKPPYKETAPSIRIMIQKYNMKLNEEGADTKVQCGSSTPPWRSPKSQERFPHDVRRVVHQNVRNNPFFDREVQKSASASQIMKRPTQNDKYRMYSKENVSDGSEMTPPLPKKMLRGILKSSSAGSLKTTSPLCLRRDYSHVKCAESSGTASGHNVVEIPKSIVPSNDSRNNISDDEGRESCERIVDDDYDKSATKFYGKKIDLDLLKLAKSSTCIPIQQFEQHIDDHLLSEPSCSRAIKLKKAKEKFLASGSKQDSVKRNNDIRENVDFSENRLSQISCGSDTSYEGYASNAQSSNIDNSLLIKSASVGMINLERQAFDKFNREKGYESLPRNQATLSAGKEMSKSGSKFALSNLASKFRKVRLRSKSKQTEKSSEKEKLDTVTKLCRQSLLVNLHGNAAADQSQRLGDARPKTERSQSQTNKSIFLAGKTGGAVAVNNENVFYPFKRSESRSSSKLDSSGGPSCSKSSQV